MARTQLNKSVQPSTLNQGFVRHAPRIKLSKEAQALLNVRRRTRRLDFEKDIQKAWNNITSLSKDLAEKHGRSLHRVTRELHMGPGTLSRTPRKSNAWNAFVFHKRQQMQDSGGDSSGRRTLIDLTMNGDTMEEYKALSKEEKAELIKELDDHKAIVARGRRPNNKSKVNDINSTLAGIIQESEALRSRTGLEVLIFTTRGTTDLSWQTTSFGTERVQDFLPTALNIETEDFCSKLEEFAVHGLKGSKVSYKKNMSNTRGDLRRLIQDKLVEITGNSKARMQYKFFWDNVVAKYFVTIENWPSDIPFGNLSDTVKQLSVLQHLLQQWQNGTIFFKSITEAEFHNLDKERTEQIQRGEVAARVSRKTRSDKGTKRQRSEAAASTNKDVSYAAGINGDNSNGNSVDGNSVSAVTNSNQEQENMVLDTANSTPSEKSVMAYNIDIRASTGEVMAGAVAQGNDISMSPPLMLPDGLVSNFPTGFSIDPSLMGPFC